MTTLRHKQRSASIEYISLLLQLAPAFINLLFCLVVVSILFRSTETYTPQIDWNLDFRILLYSNVVLILLEQVKALSRYRFLLLAARAILIAIMAIPYPNTLFLDSFLVTGFFISLVSQIPLRFTLISSLGFLIAYFSLKIIPAEQHFGLLIEFYDVIYFLGFFSSLDLLYFLARYGIAKQLQTEKVFHVLMGTIDQLTTESSHFLTYAAKAEESSSIEERKRITRELHDIIGKTFTDIIMMMDANVRNTPDDTLELKEIFQWVGEQSRLGLGEIRKVLYDLRSSIKEEPIRLKSIIGLTASFSESTHVQVRINWANAKISYGPAIDTVIYYIVQESLINTLRHGNANSIDINFWEAEKEIHLSIQDDGKEILKNGAKGLGQTGMEERLQNLKGSISFTRNTTGYLVKVAIPLHQAVQLSHM